MFYAIDPRHACGRFDREPEYPDHVEPLEQRWVRPVHVLATNFGRHSRGLLGHPRPLLVLERLVQRPQPGISPPGSGIGTYNDERLKAYTADFEVTRVLLPAACRRSDFYLGGRYASFEAGQGLRSLAVDQRDRDRVLERLHRLFDFNGLGITIGFLGRTPIGCDTCISLVWGLRGSVLWGNANRAVQTSDDGRHRLGHDLAQLRPVERMLRRRSSSKPNCGVAMGPRAALPAHVRVLAGCRRVPILGSRFQRKRRSALRSLTIRPAWPAPPVLSAT